MKKELTISDYIGMIFIGLFMLFMAVTIITTLIYFCFGGIVIFSSISKISLMLSIIALTITAITGIATNIKGE